MSMSLIIQGFWKARNWVWKVSRDGRDNDGIVLEVDRGLGAFDKYVDCSWG